MHGLYLLWWVQERGVSAALVAAVLAAGDLLVAGFEVPTGWFADRYGHRRSLILGSLIQVVGILWCWLGDGVPGLVVSTALIALADAFRSGADEALLYRSCVVLDREADFQAIEARAVAVQTVGLVALVVLGGSLVERWGFHAGWLAEAACCAMGLLLAVGMRELPSPADTPRVSATRRAGGTLRVGMLVLILPASVLGAAAGGASFLAQTSGSGNAGRVTMLVASITAAEAVGAIVASRLPPVHRLMNIGLAVAGLCLAVAALHWPVLLSAGAIALAFLHGLALPLRSAAIQRVVADHVRARTASMASALDMVASTLLLPLAGVWRTRGQR